jgi:hypothetical protein
MVVAAAGEGHQHSGHAPGGSYFECSIFRMSCGNWKPKEPKRLPLVRRAVVCAMHSQRQAEPGGAIETTAVTIGAVTKWLLVFGGCDAGR